MYVYSKDSGVGRGVEAGVVGLGVVVVLWWWWAPSTSTCNRFWGRITEVKNKLNLSMKCEAIRSCYTISLLLTMASVLYVVSGQQTYKTGAKTWKNKWFVWKHKTLTDCFKSKWFLFFKVNFLNKNYLINQT